MDIDNEQLTHSRGIMSCTAEIALVVHKRDRVEMFQSDPNQSNANFSQYTEI